MKGWSRLIHRPEVTVGGIVGAILTLAIAGTLDLFLPQAGGGWSDAIRKTIVQLFGHPWEEILLLRLAVGMAAVAVMTATGALLGALFALLLSDFFARLLRFIERHHTD
jgi:hypothetical protein